MSKYPKIYRFKEKYGDWYFLVNNQEEEDQLWLKVFKTRYEDGWYDWLKQEIEKVISIPEYTEEDIDNLPEKFMGIKQEAQLNLTIYKKEISQKKKYENVLNHINLAISENNPKKAKAVLLYFQDGEYEGFEEINISTIDDI